MHQVKKGNQWHFGMKPHIGVDRHSGLVHTVVSTAANVSDISQTPVLLHGQETELWADAGYVGVAKREDMQAALIKSEQTQTLKLHVAKRRSTIAKMSEGWQKAMAQVYGQVKGASARQSRAPVSRDQKRVSLQKGSVQGHQQERLSAQHAVFIE